MIYHILNGDALRSQFPAELSGETLVMRECLVDGPVEGTSLQSLVETRMAFMAMAYGSESHEYRKKAVREFEGMLDIPEGSEVVLWFEDDLFCQVNLWFVCHLLSEKECMFSLVRPTVEDVSDPESLRYGFGGLSEAALVEAYQQRISLNANEIHQLALLWQLYQQADLSALKEQATSMSGRFPFLLPAVEAHWARFPKEEQLGRPEQSLLSIMDALGTKEFGPVFREFATRESIYGFGDLQVKRIFDKLPI